MRHWRAASEWGDHPMLKFAIAISFLLPATSGFGDDAGPLNPRPTHSVNTIPGANIRVDADQVLAPVSVFDARGRTVMGLERSNFRLFDGAEPRPIMSLGQEDAPAALFAHLNPRRRGVPDHGFQSRRITAAVHFRFRRDSELGDISLYTGGAGLPVTNYDELCNAFSKVAVTLHNQYMLGYYPPEKAHGGRYTRGRDITCRISERLNPLTAGRRWDRRAGASYRCYVPHS